jgi:predicted pyridoxine 5'-phosphate oxidase superfamily flavin-nucleotide-binding protein
VALLFLIPGSGTTLRVNGRAHLSIAPDLLASFAVDGKPPRSVMVMTIETVFFQCARAVVRSALWDPDSRVDPASLPTPGQILAGLSAGEVGGKAYDDDWPERAKASLW